MKKIKENLSMNINADTSRKECAGEIKCMNERLDERVLNHLKQSVVKKPAVPFNEIDLNNWLADGHTLSEFKKILIDHLEKLDSSKTIGITASIRESYHQVHTELSESSRFSYELWVLSGLFERLSEAEYDAQKELLQEMWTRQPTEEEMAFLINHYKNVECRQNSDSIILDCPICNPCFDIKLSEKEKSDMTAHNICIPFERDYVGADQICASAYMDGVERGIISKREHIENWLKIMGDIEEKVIGKPRRDFGTMGKGENKIVLRAR